MTGRTRAEEARRTAQEQFAKVNKQEAVILKEKEKKRNAATEKTAGLRALRLAKEAGSR